MFANAGKPFPCQGYSTFVQPQSFFTSLCGNMKFLVKRGTQDILTAVDKMSQHTSDSLLCSMVVKKLPTFRFSYFDIFN